MKELTGQRPSRYDDHPTVRQVRARGATPPADAPLDAAWLRQVCLDAGAGDVGFVPVDHPDLAAERPYIDEVLPGIETLIGYVVRTNVDNLRSPARATANLEFHTSYDTVDQGAASPWPSRRGACGPATLRPGSPRR